MKSIVNSSSSSDNGPANTNLVVVLSRTAHVLFQNNVNSSNICTRNTIQRDRIKIDELLI